MFFDLIISSLHKCRPKLLLLIAALPTFIFFSSGRVIAQELTIYTFPSPKGINWESPRKLVFSYIANTLARSRYGKEKHPIGHMLVELRDSTRYALVGTTAVPHSGMTKKVIRKGYGLGILFETISGKLDEKEANLPQIDLRCETGDLAFIRYRINSSVFNRLWQYLEEYKQKGYGKLYNGDNKPREGQGAGCSAFAHSFLEVGGLENILPSAEWAVNVLVPEKLIGRLQLKPKWVQLFKLFFVRRWANSEKQPHRLLSLYDPTFMFNWIIKKYNSLTTTDTIQKMMLGKASGLRINCTERMPPKEPIWITAAAGQ
jgi:hypothetical protein